MTNETDGMGFDIGLDGLSDLEDRTTTSGLEVAAENVTEIAKSYPTPNNDHVSALKEAPDLVGAFDDKFGAGQAARFLGEFDREDVPAPPREITTSHVLDVMQGEPSPFEQVWSVLDDDAALKRQRRDVAILQSLNRARERPEKLGNWLDDEVRNATANYLILRKRAGDNPTEGMKSAVEAAEARFAMARDLQTRRPGWMDKRIASAKQRYEAANKALLEAYESGIVPGAVEAEARTALQVAEKADQIAADRKEGIERRLGPVERINLAEKLADAESDVMLAQDELEAAKRTPGADQAVYEDRLVEARKRARALKELQLWGEQRRPVGDAGFTGEVLRGLSRGAMSVVPELLGGAVVQHGESAGNEGVKGFGELMRRYGRSIGQDTAARANPSILELDPKSPTFGRDLKRWLGGALGEAFGTTIPIMGAYAIGGPLAGGSVGLAMGQGEMRNRLEEAFAREGLELDKQKVESYVWVYGSAIGALDAWAGFFHLEGLSGAIKEQAKTTLVRTFAKGVAKGAAVEGLTEGMQEAIGMLGEAWAVEKGIDWKEFGKAFIESFSAGAVGGAGFGAMGTPQAYRQGKAEEMREKLRKMAQETVDILQVDAAKKAEAEAKKAVEPGEAKTARTTFEQNAGEAFKKFGIESDAIQAALGPVRMDDEVRSMPVEIEVEVETEDGGLERQKMTMPAQEAINTIDRRMKGIMALLECLG